MSSILLVYFAAKVTGSPTPKISCNLVKAARQNVHLRWTKPCCCYIIHHN